MTDASDGGDENNEASEATEAKLGIAGVGAYAPRRYVTSEAVEEAWGQFAGSGVQQTSVPAGDEDTLTMAAEAARLALDAAEVDAERVARLAVGTTTPPTEEPGMPARLVSMLGLDAATTTRQVGGSATGGVSALSGSLDAEGADDAELADDDTGEEAVLVVASDDVRGDPDSAVDQAGGAGAAAVVLTPDGPGRVLGVAEHTESYPGTRFRRAGERESEELGITAYERQAYRETVAGAVESLGAAVGDDDADSWIAGVDAAAIGAPDGSLPYRASDALGVGSEAIRPGSVVHDLGDCGTATPLLGLARALDTGSESVLVVGYGAGSEATALMLEADESVPVTRRTAGTDEVSYAEYLRLRGEITPGEPAGGGAYVSVPSWRRTLPQRHRLVAGECPDCGALAFPPEGACRDCHELVEYESVRLARRGAVETATTIGQGGAPPEFVEQQARGGSYVSAVVAFGVADAEAGGGDADRSVSVPMQVVECDETPAVGTEVRTTIRRIYEQEGVIRYGLKAVPAEAERDE
ncbi:zinc ribbon domain-containing protein [Salinirubrum litoreum]|uniref:Zinc ribbon domain-containing protein n=1 Tax=Salinirubrum litoreum TaxID=1126234 RepID=A0ABD5RG44_9EURY|nr:zinc ribbon domain-containing protein [Salinirubrum litoreum]